MTKYTGSRREIAFTKETIRLTAVAHSAGDWLANTGFGFKPAVNKAEDRSAKGLITTLRQKHKVQQYAEGDANFNATIKNIGTFFCMLFGAVPSSSGASDVYTHSYTLDNDNNSHLTYTTHTIIPNQGVEKYAGTMLDEMEMTVVPDDYIKVKLGLKALAAVAGTGSSSYNTLANDPIIVPYNATIKLASDYSGLGAADAVAFASLKLNFKKNVDFDWKIGDDDPGDLWNGNFDAEGEIKIVHDEAIAETLRGYSIGDTTQALQIVVSDGTYGFTLEFPTVLFENYDPETALDAAGVLTLKFEATDADATNGIVKGEVINNVASY